MKKRLLAMLLAVMLMVSLLPVAVFAVDDGVYYYGEDGNLIWRYEDGTLTISGTGELPSYHAFASSGYARSDTPWYYALGGDDEDNLSYVSKMIHSVVIEEGVTNVSKYLLCGLQQLTEVKLPSSITAINKGAFAACSALPEITIPAGVKTIGERAFWGCRALVTVRIEEGVEVIDNQAFKDCYALETLYLPASLVMVNGSDVFIYCNALSDIYYAGTEEQWDAIEMNMQTRNRLEQANIHFGEAAPAPEVPEEPEVTDTPFTDVSESDWFYNPVLWAYENNVTGGTSATTFGPDDSCTRAQVVTFLWAANGKPEPKSMDNPFTDVADDAWYVKPVLWAVENGITTGVSATEFGPENTCTRAQIATFLYAAAGKPTVEGSSEFVDVVDSDWFANPIIWAAQNEVTGGIGDGKFGPNNTCTRGQVVTFLYKVYG